MKFFIVFFIIFNKITFGIFGIDKLFARMNRQRISEKTLIIMAIVSALKGNNCEHFVEEAL